MAVAPKSLKFYQHTILFYLVVLLIVVWFYRYLSFRTSSISSSSVIHIVEP
jgi:hypothetical protein